MANKPTIEATCCSCSVLAPSRPFVSSCARSSCRAHQNSSRGLFVCLSVRSFVCLFARHGNGKGMRNRNREARGFPESRLHPNHHHHDHHSAAFWRTFKWPQLGFCVCVSSQAPILPACLIPATCNDVVCPKPPRALEHTKATQHQPHLTKVQPSVCLPMDCHSELGVSNFARGAIASIKLAPS